jgi:septum formation protein
MRAAPDFIYLASQSPRRQELLRQIGVRFQLLLPGPEEDAEALEAERPGEAPARYVQRVTGAKLDAALRRMQGRGLPQAPVLCADTTVALGGEVLGKPRDAGHALAMLRRLSGHTHQVLTAVAIGQSDLTKEGLRIAAGLSRSRVRFADVPLTELRAYVAGGEPFGKAGAYALQGAAAAWVEHLSGSASGVVGLPIALVRQLLISLSVWPGLLAHPRK